MRTPGWRRQSLHSSLPFNTPVLLRASLKDQKKEYFLFYTTQWAFSGTGPQTASKGTLGRPPPFSHALGSVCLEYTSELPAPSQRRAGLGLPPASSCHGNPSPNPAWSRPKACPLSAGRWQSPPPRQPVLGAGQIGPTEGTVLVRGA